MKLEVGMYVRHKPLLSSKYVKINKIKEIEEKENCLHIWLEDKDLITEKYLIKASYNIIDILEVGDYANGYYISKIWEKDEITHYVNETPIKRKEREIVIQAPSYGGIEILKNKNIKSVITHEQIEQMAYKVGE